MFVKDLISGEIIFRGKANVCFENYVQGEYEEELQDGGVIKRDIRFVPENKDELYDYLMFYIYAYYPPVKQQSDIADKNYYETLLKAKGVTDLEADIVERAKRFFEGESLEAVVADVADENKEAYTQLLKVAIRVKWVQDCKAELKEAVAEGREPNFPKYPL